MLQMLKPSDFVPRAAYFGDRLRLPAKPNLLLNAEREADRTRAEHSAARAQLVELIQVRTERPGAVDKEAIAAAEAAVAVAGQKRSPAAQERDRRRAAFAVKAREELGPAVDEYRVAISAQIDALEDLLRPGLDLAAAAAVNGVELHLYISAIRAAFAQLHEIRRTLGGS